MSKKTRRQPRREPIQPRQPDTTAAPGTRKGLEFNPDYSDTIKDLKRIGTLAGTFVTILVLLSFFLR
jgi:hypothetical protein